MKASNARQLKASALSTANPEDVARFNALAGDWWDPTGPMRPLHAMTPVRLRFLRDAFCAHFGRDTASRTPLAGLSVLDIGCGAGLASEPLCRLGARVTGMDAAPDAIAAAKAHAKLAGLDIRYDVGGPEALAAGSGRFDAVVALEVLEHVEDVDLFLSHCALQLKTDGILAFSTLNRTAASFVTAIAGAEYLLRLLPRGTHNWRKFLTPQELEAALGRAGFVVGAIEGMGPDLRHGGWRLTRRTPVNYIGWARRA